MKYQYVGDGAGVPGLPHVINDAEAAALGVTELLQQAVANGSYAPEVTPTPIERGEKKSKKGDVNNG